MLVDADIVGVDHDDLAVESLGYRCRPRLDRDHSAPERWLRAIRPETHRMPFRIGDASTDSLPYARSGPISKPDARDRQTEFDASSEAVETLTSGSERRTCRKIAGLIRRLVEQRDASHADSLKVLPKGAVNRQKRGMQHDNFSS